MPPRKPLKPVYALTEPVKPTAHVDEAVWQPATVDLVAIEPEPEITEPVIEKPRIPVFDHSQPVGLEVSTNHRNLVQGVHRFTYAELDKQKGRYVPEPKYIPPGRIHKSELIQKIEKLNELLDKLPNMILDLQESVANNAGLFKED